MSAIETDGLTRSYGDLQALAGLSLSVERGDLFGFLGPNGAGKTTTLKILTGQLVPDGGTASVLGVDPATDPVAVRRAVGILPEQESPPDFMTPREYFDFAGTVRRLDDAAVERRVASWAERLGFEEKLDTLNTDLSRGQQQKVMITQAFLHEPAVAFIDEPLANLDPIVQERFKRFLREYVEAGNAVFISTHDIAVAAEVCSRVGIVDRGRLIAEYDRAEFEDGEALLETFLENVGAQDAGEFAAPDGVSAADGASSGDGRYGTSRGA